MKLLLLVVVLGYAHRAHGNPGPLDLSKIKGGVGVDIKEHPSMAKLVANSFKDTKYCGGTVISDIYILTAAGCLQGVLVTVSIFVGHTNVKGVKVSYTSSYQKPHPYYQANRPDYNIGLVKSDTKMKIGGNVQIARLAEATSTVRPGDILVIPGWGMANGPMLSDTLNEIRLPAISKRDCDTAYQAVKNFISPRNFCAVAKTVGRGVCQGDGGSPAIKDHIQVGIVSYTKDCSDTKSPVVFTDVASLRSWIMSEAGV